MNDKPTIRCKYCGQQTPMLGTQQCNNCWEVASRIGFMPIAVLAKILKAEKEGVTLTLPHQDEPEPDDVI